MNLTNVARSSLDEARKEYIKHLARRGLRHWQEGEAIFTEARNLRPKTLEEAAAWVNRPGVAEPAEERAANLGAILAAQAHWLTERLLDRHARDFEAGGGFSERLYRARTGKDPVKSVPSVKPARTGKIARPAAGHVARGRESGSLQPVARRHSGGVR